MKEASDFDTNGMSLSLVEELDTLGIRFTAYRDTPRPMMSIAVYPMKDGSNLPGFFFGFDRESWVKFVDLVKAADTKWRPQ